MADVDVKQYIEQLAQSAGLTDDVKASMLKVVETNDKFAKALGEGVMLRSDYSRAQDSLRNEREGFTKTKQEWTDFYNGLVQWKAGEEQRLADLAKRYNGNADLNNGDHGNQTVLTTEALESLKKEFTEKQQSQERNFLTLLKGVGSLTSDYVTRFKEKPDLDAIEKIAIEKNVPLMQAYDMYIAPRLQTQQQADFDARLKAAREEGAKDALSKHRLPVDTAPREFHPLLDRGVSDTNVPEKGPARDRWIRDEFMRDLQSTPNPTSGGTTG